MNWDFWIAKGTQKKIPKNGYFILHKILKTVAHILADEVVELSSAIYAEVNKNVWNQSQRSWKKCIHCVVYRLPHCRFLQPLTFVHRAEPAFCREICLSRRMAILQNTWPLYLCSNIFWEPENFFCFLSFICRIFATKYFRKKIKKW